MPAPTPDPVQEIHASGHGGFLGWADFATISAAIVAVLTFLGTLLARKGRVAEAHFHDNDVDPELEQLKARVREVRTLAEDLDDSYSKLKKEIESLEENIKGMDKSTSKDIKKMEEEISDLKKKMDRIIELMMKLLSEQ